MKFRRASDRTIDVTRLSSLVDAGVEIVGDVLITEGLRVDGSIRGDVRGKPDTKGLLVLSQSGRIEGNVRVHDAVVNGTITGDLEVDHYLELQSGARITGNIRYRQLKMDCGAAVDGRLDRLGEQPAAVVGGDNVVTLTRALAGD